MKTNVNKKSGKLLGLAAMMIVGCKQVQGNSSSEGNKKHDTPPVAFYPAQQTCFFASR